MNAHYMRLLTDLRSEINRELDAVQVDQPSRSEFPLAIDAVMVARAEYERSASTLVSQPDLK